MTLSSNPAPSIGWANRPRTMISGVYPRLVGALILFKLMIPVFILGFLFFGLWSMARHVNMEFNRLNASLQPKFERVEGEIEKIRDEGRRLADKVAQIKNEGARVGSEIKNAVEPIRQSLVAISTTVGAISNTMESFINSLVRVLRKVPFVHGLKGVHFPRIDIPGFKLPELNIDLALTFNTAALDALKEVIAQIAYEAEATLDALKRIWLTFWWTFKVVVFLVLSWFVLSLIGIVARYWLKLKTGVQLLTGRIKTANLQML